MKGGGFMKKLCACVSVLVLTGMLFFTSIPAATAAEAGPYYVGIFGGWVMPDDLKVEGPGGSADVSLKDSWALGIKGGYIIPTVKWLAVELEYSYLAKQDIDVSRASGDYSANNLMANFLVRYPEGRIHPYAGVGVGWSWGAFKGSGTATRIGTGSVDESDNAFAWQILAGVNFDITPNWSADLAYRYFTSKYTINSGGDDFDVTSKNHMILIGVNYRF
jgi:opacity protein-like surface antigen